MCGRAVPEPLWLFAWYWVLKEALVKVRARRVYPSLCVSTPVSLPLSAPTERASFFPEATFSAVDTGGGGSSRSAHPLHCCALLWLQATGDGLGKPLHTVCFHGVAEAMACAALDAPADAMRCCSAVGVTVAVDGVVDPSWYRAQTPGVTVPASACDCTVYRVVFFAVPPSI